MMLHEYHALEVELGRAPARLLVEAERAGEVALPLCSLFVLRAFRMRISWPRIQAAGHPSREGF